MRIRKAKINDISQIAKLCHELYVYNLKFDESYKFKVNIEKILSKMFKKIIYSRNSVILVAEIDGKIIGFIIGRIVKRSEVFKIEKNGEIGGAVTLRFRRKGIGQKLTQELTKWFKQKNIKWVELEVDAKNSLAISAWKKFGFKDFQLRFKLKL